MAEQGKPIVVNNITVARLYRTKEDIQTWQSAVSLAETLYHPRRKRLYEIYQRVVLDGFLYAIMQKRIQEITNQRLVVKNAKGDVDKEAGRITDRPWFQDMLRHIIESRFYGHSLIEPRISSGEVVGVDTIPRHHVSPEKGVILKRWTDIDGISFRKGKYAKQLLEVGHPKDLGLLMKAAPYVLYKQGGLADWAHFVELFGMPIRVYSYNPHDATSRIEVEKQAKEQGSAAYFIKPEGVDLELKEAGNATGSAALYSEMRQALNNELAVLILGNQLTTQNEETGAFSLGKVHSAEQQKIHADDMRFVEGVLNYTGRPFLEYWGVAPSEGYYYEFDRTEHLSISQRIDVDTKLNNLVSISPGYFYERYNVPPPTEQEQAEIDARLQQQLQQQREGGQQGQGGTPAEGDPDEGDPEPAAVVDLDTYYNRGVDCCEQEPVAAVRLNKLVRAFASFIQAVFDGFTGLHEPLMIATAAELVRGWQTGYQVVDPDYDTRIRRNIFAFSGAKTLDQLVALRDRVYVDGRKVPFTEFRAYAQTIWQQYHEGYLEAEYNQVVRAGTMAQKWQRIERTKNLYPYLEYKTEGDARVRPEHQAMDGIVLPVTDEFWDTYYPPNGWRCRCSVRQVTRSEVTSGQVALTDSKEAVDMATPNADRYWHGNVGKRGLIFRDDHPYFRRLDDASKQQIDRIFRNAQRP